MQKWEYTIIVFGPESPLIIEMNGLGREGWEIFKMEQLGQTWRLFAKKPV